jgi:toxin ParE1/3/4
VSTIARSRRARADLVELAIFYGERSSRAANKLLDQIDAAAKFLAEHPYGGRARPDLRQDLRSFPVRPFVLFYLPQAGGVEIVRALHGSRDIGPHLFDDA